MKIESAYVTIFKIGVMLILIMALFVFLYNSYGFGFIIMILLIFAIILSIIDVVFSRMSKKSK